jgi:nucleotide sugar dehydrogenase
MHRVRIAIVGTGVVGTGVMEAWRFRGYPVTGYDVNPDLIKRHQDNGLDVRHIEELINSDANLLFVCVNTPQAEDGAVNLKYLNSALESVGRWIKSKPEGYYPMVVQRSTTLPTLSKTHIIPVLERFSGLVCGEGFGYAHLPEILRETEALTDSLQIWHVVIGEYDGKTADMLEEMYGEPVLGSYKDVLLSRVPVEVAEAAKYIFNVHNATRISFYNSMALFLQSLGIDAQASIDLSVCMGEGTLNPLYGTKVVFPYGGMCLPKDTAALLHLAAEFNKTLPVLAAAAEVNRTVLDLVESGQVPPPVKEGFRRFTAAEMRDASIGTALRLKKEREKNE